MIVEVEGALPSLQLGVQMAKVLTNHAVTLVYGMEVTSEGFHRLIFAARKKEDDYFFNILEPFDELGLEIDPYEMEAINEGVSGADLPNLHDDLSAWVVKARPSDALKALGLAS